MSLRYNSVVSFCFSLCQSLENMAWASYQIRKIAGCACAGNAGNIFPHCRIQWKPRVSDPGMHHGTCVTHVPWCMSGLLTRGGGENVPSIPGACAPAILRIWQEAHGLAWIAARISSHIANKVWDEIIYPFPNFYEVWEWICNFMLQFITDVITYPPYHVMKYM